MGEVEKTGRVGSGIGGKRRESQRKAGGYEFVQFGMEGSACCISAATGVREGSEGHLVAMLISPGRAVAGALSFSMLRNGGEYATGGCEVGRFVYRYVDQQQMSERRTSRPLKHRLC
jgi:hypothetical protein